MTDSNEQYAYFTVAGDFDPTEISRAVARQPNECWKKGDINPKTQLERQFSRWSLFSQLERQNPLEAHIQNVLDQLGSDTPAFQEISAQYGGVMQLVAYFKTDDPGFHLESRIVQQLASYGLSIDCDFYFLYASRREDS